MKPTKARVFWDEAAWPWQAAAILVAIDLIGLGVARFACGWAIYGARAPGETSSPDHLMAIVGNWPIVARILLVAAFAMLYTGRGVPLRAFGLVKSGFRKRLAEFGKCLAVIVPLAAAASLMMILFLRMGGGREHIAPPLSFATSTQSWRWILVFVVALPPFEEFLYRGVVHPVMRRHMGVTGAVAVGGLLFALLHWFYGIDLASLVAYGFGGAALAWVYERTGSLIFPWLLHVATNLVGVWISSYPGLFEALRT
jgi:membrane protease YdiL (CAAX protease family)